MKWYVVLSHFYWFRIYFHYLQVKILQCFYSHFKRYLLNICILGVSLRDVGKRLILPRMIIPLLQLCCRHMFVSGIGWRLNIFFTKEGMEILCCFEDGVHACFSLQNTNRLLSLKKGRIFLWLLHGAYSPSFIIVMATLNDYMILKLICKIC